MAATSPTVTSAPPQGAWARLKRTLKVLFYEVAGALFAVLALAWLNLVGLLTVMVVRRLEFTSLWCAYAAVVSVVVYFFFRNSRPDRPANYSLEAAV